MISWKKCEENLNLILLRVRKLIEKCSDEEIFEEYNEKPDKNIRQ